MRLRTNKTFLVLVSLLSVVLCSGCFIWTNASGDGMWDNAANWYDSDIRSVPANPPGAGDDVWFGTVRGQGCDDPCTISGPATCASVMVLRNYTSTVTVANGGTLDVQGAVSQVNGTVSVAAGGTLLARGGYTLQGGNVDVAGTLVASDFDQPDGTVSVQTGGLLRAVNDYNMTDGSLDTDGTVRIANFVQDGRDTAVSIGTNGWIDSAGDYSLTDGTLLSDGSLSCVDFTQSGRRSSTTLDSNSNWLVTNLAVNDGPYTMNAGSVLNVRNGGAIQAAAASTFTLAGTGSGAGQYVTIQGETAADHFSATFAGDTDINYALFNRLANGGITLSGDSGATAQFGNVYMIGLESGSGTYLTVTGDAWAAYVFDGLGFGDVPGATTVNLNIAGQTTHAQFANFQTGPGWMSGDATDYDAEDGNGDDWAEWGPLSVFMESVRAEPAAGGVLVAWTTCSERSNAGFNVYRAEMLDAERLHAGSSRDAVQAGRHPPLFGFGNWVRVNDTLVPAARASSGRKDYSLLDGSVAPGTTYAYAVEDVDTAKQAHFWRWKTRFVRSPFLRARVGSSSAARLRGAVARSGAAKARRSAAARSSCSASSARVPVKARGGSAGGFGKEVKRAAVTILGRGAPEYPQEPLPALGQLLSQLDSLLDQAAAAPGTAPAGRRFEVTATSSALVELDQAALSATGFDLTGNLCLYNMGLPVDTDIVRNVGGEITSLCFHSLQPASRYAAANVYWLSDSPLETGLEGLTQQIAAVEADLAQKLARPDDPAPICMLRTIVHEERDELYYTYYAPFFPGEGLDCWYFDHWLVEGDPFEVDLAVDAPLPVRAKIRLRLFGQSADADVEGDHRLGVSMNGEAVGEVRWDGFAPVTAELIVPRGLVADGVNSLRVEVLPGEAAFDVSLVDWVEVEYFRTPAVDGDAVEFVLKAGEGGLVSVSGFSTDELTAAVEGRNLVHMLDVTTSPDGGTYTAEVTVPRMPFERTVRIAARSLAFAPDSVVEDFPAGLRSAGNVDYLIVTHSTLAPEVTPLEDHHRNSGLDVFVADVEEVYDEFNWGVRDPEAIRRLANFYAPRFLLLAGGTTFDYKDATGFGTQCLVPSYLTMDSFLEIPTDLPFGCLDDGDMLPDVAVGRIPARSPQEMANAVAKTIARLNSPPSGPYSILLAAGNEADTFEVTSDEIADIMGGAVEKVYRSGLTEQDAHDAIVAGLLAGTDFLNLFGHGYVDMWDTYTVLNAGQVAEFDAAAPFITVQLSCLTGDFDGDMFDAGWRSLAEEMLHSSGGAAAVIASSGNTPDQGEGELSKALYSQLATGDITLGEALMNAKHAIPAGHHDVPYAFNLLGDPAIK